jgi:hypothetical protein
MLSTAPLVLTRYYNLNFSAARHFPTLTIKVVFPIFTTYSFFAFKLRENGHENPGLIYKRDSVL